MKKRKDSNKKFWKKWKKSRNFLSEVLQNRDIRFLHSQSQADRLRELWGQYKTFSAQDKRFLRRQRAISSEAALGRRQTGGADRRSGSNDMGLVFHNESLTQMEEYFLEFVALFNQEYEMWRPKEIADVPNLDAASFESLTNSEDIFPIEFSIEAVQILSERVYRLTSSAENPFQGVERPLEILKTIEIIARSNYNLQAMLHFGLLDILELLLTLSNQKLAGHAIHLDVFRDVVRILLTLQAAEIPIPNTMLTDLFTTWVSVRDMGTDLLRSFLDLLRNWPNNLVDEDQYRLWEVSRIAIESEVLNEHPANLPIFFALCSLAIAGSHGIEQKLVQIHNFEDSFEAILDFFPPEEKYLELARRQYRVYPMAKKCTHFPIHFFVPDEDGLGKVVANVDETLFTDLVEGLREQLIRSLTKSNENPKSVFTEKFFRFLLSTLFPETDGDAMPSMVSNPKFTLFAMSVLYGAAANLRKDFDCTSLISIIEKSLLSPVTNYQVLVTEWTKTRLRDEDLAVRQKTFWLLRGTISLCMDGRFESPEILRLFKSIERHINCKELRCIDPKVLVSSLNYLVFEGMFKEYSEEKALLFLDSGVYKALLSWLIDNMRLRLYRGNPQEFLTMNGELLYIVTRSMEVDKLAARYLHLGVFQKFLEVGLAMDNIILQRLLLEKAMWILFHTYVSQALSNREKIMHFFTADFFHGNKEILSILKALAERYVGESPAFGGELIKLGFIRSILNHFLKDKSLLGEVLSIIYMFNASYQLVEETTEFESEMHFYSEKIISTFAAIESEAVKKDAFEKILGIAFGTETDISVSPKIVNYVFLGIAIDISEQKGNQELRNRVLKLIESSVQGAFSEWNIKQLSNKLHVLGKLINMDIDEDRKFKIITAISHVSVSHQEAHKIMDHFYKTLDERTIAFIMQKMRDYLSPKRVYFLFAEEDSSITNLINKSTDEYTICFWISNSFSSIKISYENIPIVHITPYQIKVLDAVHNYKMFPSENSLIVLTTSTIRREFMLMVNDEFYVTETLPMKQHEKLQHSSVSIHSPMLKVYYMLQFRNKFLSRGELSKLFRAGIEKGLTNNGEIIAPSHNPRYGSKTILNNVTRFDSRKYNFVGKIASAYGVENMLLLMEKCFREVKYIQQVSSLITTCLTHDENFRRSFLAKKGVSTLVYISSLGPKNVALVLRIVVGLLEHDSSRGPLASELMHNFLVYSMFEKSHKHLNFILNIITNLSNVLAPFDIERYLTELLSIEEVNPDIEVPKKVFELVLDIYILEKKDTLNPIFESLVKYCHRPTKKPYYKWIFEIMHKILEKRPSVRLFEAGRDLTDYFLLPKNVPEISKDFVSVLDIKKGEDMPSVEPYLERLFIPEISTRSLVRLALYDGILTSERLLALLLARRQEIEIDEFSYVLNNIRLYPVNLLFKTEVVFRDAYSGIKFTEFSTFRITESISRSLEIYSCSYQSSGPDDTRSYLEHMYLLLHSDGIFDVAKTLPNAKLGKKNIIKQFVDDIASIKASVVDSDGAQRDPVAQFVLESIVVDILFNRSIHTKKLCNAIPSEERTALHGLLVPALTEMNNSVNKSCVYYLCYKEYIDLIIHDNEYASVNHGDIVKLVQSTHLPEKGLPKGSLKENEEEIGRLFAFIREHVADEDMHTAKFRNNIKPSPTAYVNTSTFETVKVEPAPKRAAVHRPYDNPYLDYLNMSKLSGILLLGKGGSTGARRLLNVENLERRRLIISSQKLSSHFIVHNLDFGKDTFLRQYECHIKDISNTSIRLLMNVSETYIGFRIFEILSEDKITNFDFSLLSKIQIRLIDLMVVVENSSVEIHSNSPRRAVLIRFKKQEDFRDFREHFSKFFAEPEKMIEAVAADWQMQKLSSFEFLMAVNTLSGRTYSVPKLHPVFPITQNLKVDGRVINSHDDILAFLHRVEPYSTLAEQRTFINRLNPEVCIEDQISSFGFSLPEFYGFCDIFGGYLRMGRKRIKPCHYVERCRQRLESVFIKGSIARWVEDQFKVRLSSSRKLPIRAAPGPLKSAKKRYEFKGFYLVGGRFESGYASEYDALDVKSMKLLRTFEFGRMGSIRESYNYLLLNNEQIIRLEQDPVSGGITYSLVYQNSDMVRFDSIIYMMDTMDCIYGFDFNVGYIEITKLSDTVAYDKTKVASKFTLDRRLSGKVVSFQNGDKNEYGMLLFDKDRGDIGFYRMTNFADEKKKIKMHELYRIQVGERLKKLKYDVESSLLLVYTDATSRLMLFNLYTGDEYANYDMGIPFERVEIRPGGDLILLTGPNHVKIITVNNTVIYERAIKRTECRITRGYWVPGPGYEWKILLLYNTNEVELFAFVETDFSARSTQKRISLPAEIMSMKQMSIRFVQKHSLLFVGGSGKLFAISL